MKTYRSLLDRYREISNLKGIEELLQWDQEVLMPKEGVKARSEQILTVSSLKHELLSDDKITKLLKDLEKKKLDKEQKSVIREIEREHNRTKKVPKELIKEISKTTSEAFEVWRKAKEKNDFSLFSTKLNEVVELKKEYAEKIDPGRPSYEVLFEDYEPYIGLPKTENILKDLGDKIPNIIEKQRNRDVDADVDINLNISRSKQNVISRKILGILGYNWNKGRLDTSPHPFSSGNQFDIRITTNYEDNIFNSVMSTIHEFGHALYNLNLPKDNYGSPLGQSREMVIHESQSRLWENHVGRSKEFCRLLLSEIDLNVSVDKIYRYLNNVDPGPIRTKSDEITYHMHILVRFEVEKQIFKEEINIEDIPSVWNEKMDQYLGVKPSNDSEGCLQDVHWSHGSFGYFPCYTLGSVLSAQIYSSVTGDLSKNDIDLKNKIQNGDFEDINKWLKNNIHRHGKIYTTNDLIKKSTGSDLKTDDFLEYIKNKYK